MSSFPIRLLNLFLLAIAPGLIVMPPDAIGQESPAVEPHDLESGAFPDHHMPVEPLAEFQPGGKGGPQFDSTLAAALARIEKDSLYSIVAGLEAHGTRYEFSAQQESAAVYLFDRLSDMGYNAAFHSYEISTWDIRDITFADTLTGWFVASSGGENDSSVIARTDDGGATWQADTIAPKRMYGVKAIGRENVWAVGAAGAVFHFDGGQWTEQPPLSAQRLVSVDFLDAARGFIAGRDATIYRTNNGGISWDTSSVGIPKLNDLRYVDENAAWACGTHGRIARLSGEQWEVQETPTFKTIYQLDFIDSSFGCAAMSDSSLLIWNGETWHTVRSELRFAYSTTIIADSTILLCGPDITGVNHVYRSNNRGTTWNEVMLPSAVLFTTPLAIHAQETGEVILGGIDGLLLSSTERGESWGAPALPGEMVHPSRNVYADHHGEKRPDEMIVLSGHYDSIIQTGGNAMEIAPGADDDASGVAAVLEAARVLADLPTERTIRFLLFSGEELGLLGSTAYAIAEREADRNVIADVQVDMIGIPNGDPLRLIANEESIWILAEAAPLRELYTPDLEWSLLISPNETFSDHASFWANGYDGIQVSETIDFESNPLHTPGDTLGNLDFDFSLQATKLTTALVATMAGIVEEASTTPTEAGQAAAYPNPGSSRFTIRVNAPGGERIEVIIYNTAGREVWQSSAVASAGVTTYIEWDSRDRHGDQVRAGVYLARIKSAGIEKTRKLVLVR